MSSSSFDALSRALAAGTSRRSLLRGLAGGLGAAALASHATEARGRTVEICHKTWAWSTDWRTITVNANDTRKINAHIEHGDVVDPDYSSDPNHCGGCGNTCEAPANATAWCGDGVCGFHCNVGHQWDGTTCALLPICWYQRPDTSAWVVASEYLGGTFSRGSCQDADGCFPGGGGRHGGCFKWTVHADDPFTAWP